MANSGLGYIDVQPYSSMLYTLHLTPNLLAGSQLYV